MFAVFALAVVWAAFLLPHALRRFRDGRPGSSVVSFRQQLSTLERATPGHSLRLSTTGPVPVVKSVPPASKSQVRRRRDVLLVLIGATAITFLLMVGLGGVATYLFLLSAASLGAYCYALVQLRRRAEERARKVRVLTPRTAPSPTLALRRSASN